MSLSSLAEVLQWGLIAALVLLVFFLVRQVAALSALLREGRASVATNAGPRPHLPLGRQQVSASDGSSVELGAGRAVLLLFLTEGCSTCRGMREALGALGRDIDAEDLELAFVEDDPPPGVAGRAHPLRRGAVPPLLVPASPAPAVLAVAADGRVAAVGAPRVPEHLLEMSHVARFADSTSDGHMLRHHVWGDAVPSWDLESKSGASQG